jgi:hypothetical protein
MTDPFDPATADEDPGAKDGSPVAPVVSWDQPATGGGAVVPGSRRGLDIVIWVVAFAALIFLSLLRADIEGSTGSERIGYVIGGVVFALLISAAARWLWLRARRRNDAAAQLISPWIPVGAVIVVLLSLFGRSPS